ncbi:MAG: hypothetical protein JJT88_19025 [Gammaproteobacteria bacterium]|nr:hypothetical protein [Gammaproteobacteria bacterium]
MDGFASYYGLTNLHPLALAFVILLGLAVLAVPRRYALLPLFVAATTAPMAQRFVVAGADFTLLRMLLLAYLLRLIMRGGSEGFVWNRLDTAVVLWALVGTTIFVIHHGTGAALINRAGWSYDILLTYFAARLLIRDFGDVLALARGVAVVSIPVAALFLVERSTAYNLFSVFGGVPSTTSIREGLLRCQGPFAHPILAGTFWASTLPLIWILWREGGFDRTLTLLGSAGALIIVFACASSTPILTVGVAFVGMGLFAFRDQRRLIWLGVFATLFILHFFLMNKPVWHLMARVDLIGGSTGWHRYWIFETFIRNFSEWRLTGHANPMEWGVWQMRDITNQYVLEGLRGGIWTLSLLLLVLTLAFANVGRALGPAQPATAGTNYLRRQWKLWLIGVAILAHVVSFFGVSYFGQMITIFYLQLAIAGCVYALADAQTETEAGERPVESGSRASLVGPGRGAPSGTAGVLGRDLVRKGFGAAART